MPARRLVVSSFAPLSAVQAFHMVCVCGVLPLFTPPNRGAYSCVTRLLCYYNLPSTSISTSEPRLKVFGMWWTFLA